MRSGCKGLAAAWAWLAAFCILAPLAARAEPEPAPVPPAEPSKTTAPVEPSAAPVEPPAAPAAPPSAVCPKALEETAPVTFGDSAKAAVTVRVPLALHRPANAFRLYGGRPLTLQDRTRRRDLYRDAFLELA